MRIGEKLLTIGPNRRSERTLYELQLIPEPAEREGLSAHGPKVVERLRAHLPSPDHECWQPLDDALEADAPLASAARLFNALALGLQRVAGHRVAESGWEADAAGVGVWTWWEYEHDGVAVEAAGFALRLLESAVAGRSGIDPEELGAFLDRARDGVLPRDTEALVRAAARLDIPCAKLERDPYPGLAGNFRVRRNGLLKFGHGRHRQIVDGTFCVSRCARAQPLIRDREAMRSLLASMGVPLPRRAPGGDNCALTRRALRAAETIGYPVVVRPGVRSRGAGTGLDLRNEAGVRAAVEAARSVSPLVALESMVPGQSHRLLLAGGEPVAMIAGGHERPVADAHTSILQVARDIAARLDVGLLELDVVTPDIGRPLDETGGAVVDADPAPELDRLLPAGSGLFDIAADRFLRWLFPVGASARIPILAVTGTNGKTTTCRMTARILRHAGLRAGLVCSEGVYIDETRESGRRDVGPGVHHFMLDRDDVDIVVFEEYFGSIARIGFAYRWCDVAVCTNVTNDHLGRIGAHTLEQMAQLKFAVPRRARHVAVLNADNDGSRAMGDRAEAGRICLVSTRRPLVDEARSLGPRAARCVVERCDGVDWAVLYDLERRIPLLPVDDIPAAFGGAAEFNVANALHAAAACHFAGVSPEHIAAGLASFELSFETAPARLNRFEGLPFQVIMDYAHNADGWRQLCTFTDRLEVSGRRIVMVSGTGDRRDADLRTGIAELAGHFDEYVLRNYRGRRGREPEEIPELLRQGLLEAGVDDRRLHLVPDADEAVGRALDLARPGDLVVLLPGDNEFEDVWRRLEALAGIFAKQRPGAAELQPSSTAFRPATK